MDLFHLRDGLITMTCSATAHRPDGSVIGTVTGESYLRILAPDRFMEMTPGTTQMLGDPLFPTGIRAGDPDDISGMTFSFWCETPEEFLYFGSGTYALAQKCSIDRDQFQIGVQFPIQENSGGFKLDNSFPYTGTWSASPPPLAMEDGDSPSWGLNPITTYSVYITDDFTMFVIYKPPPYFGSSVEWVPVRLGWWTWHTISDVPGDPQGDPEGDYIEDLPWESFEWDGVYLNN